MEQMGGCLLVCVVLHVQIDNVILVLDEIIIQQDLQTEVLDHRPLEYTQHEIVRQVQFLSIKSVMILMVVSVTMSL